MAYFTAAPTLCEVTYDKNTEDRITPYRYQCRSATTRLGTGSQSPTFTEATFSLPSGYNVSYYEYLRTLYDSRISNTTKTSGYVGSGPSPGYHSARNPYAHTSYPGSHSIQESRPKTASPFTQTDHRSPHPQPSSLPFIRHGWGPPVGDEDDGAGEGGKGFDDRLQWIDALNKWIPEHNQNRPGYLTFVGNAPMVDKILREVHAQREREKELQRSKELCERYEQHMMFLEQRAKSQPKPLHPENSFAHRLMTLKKREAMRKKANEMLELRKQQRTQASSSADKKHRVRFQTPNYQPKPKRFSSPTKDLITVPKDNQDQDPAESEISSHISQSDVDTSRSRLLEEAEEEDVDGKPESASDTMVVEPSTTHIEEESDKESKSSALPQIAMETTEKAENVEADDSKKPKKSSSKTNVAKSKPTSEPKAKRTKGKSKGEGKQVKTVKPQKEKPEKEEEPVQVIEEVKPIPTIGETKTGPLSLVGGRESPVKKTKANIADIQKRRRAAALFNRKTATTPSPPPTPPRSPTPPLVEETIEEKEKPPETTGVGLPSVDITEPALPDPDSFLKQTTSSSKNKRIAITTPILKLQQKLQRKQFQRDTSYEDELRRQELAEKRKQKQMEMLEKMKSRRNQMGSEFSDADGMLNFEDYGFLAKYCIFNKANIEMYRHTFDAVDDERRGWLQGIEAMIALRGVNTKLTTHEEEYLYRIMELTGYNISQGADFKLFSVLAALSQRISSLDHWMKNLIGAMDWGTLEMKMYMCKTLWECNVDKDTNKIPLDQLCVELRAGGVSPQHEREVREKLQHLEALDLLDFLTYVPLFIMIHESVVDNPLSDTRDK